MAKKKTKGQKKIAKTMSEYGKGKLHSGSKEGPKVTEKAQAVAIALSQAGKSKKKKKKEPRFWAAKKRKY